MNSSDLTNYKQFYMQTETFKFFKTNLSDIIEDIETASYLDVAQIIIEVLFSILCIGGNLLTILVLRRVALKHPAQALRLALAVHDLIVGVFGCATSVGFHSYYLWCAVDIDRCQYEVDILQFNNSQKMFIVFGFWPMIYYTVFFISLCCSVHLAWIMSIERYFAICRPMKHKIYFSIPNIRLLVLAMLIFGWGNSIFWKSLENTALRWSLFYKPEIKFFTHVHTNKYITVYQKIYNISSMLMTFVLSLIFTSITIWKLKVSKKIRETLRINNSTSIKEAKNPKLMEVCVCDKYKSSTMIIQEKTTYIFQQESLIDMTITHMWFIIIEVTLFVLNTSLFVYVVHIAQLQEHTQFNIVLHASYWMVLAASSFNFILYNIRIPAFRKASWDVITYLPRQLKVCHIPAFRKTLWDIIAYFPRYLKNHIPMKTYSLDCNKSGWVPKADGTEVDTYERKWAKIKKNGE